MNSASGREGGHDGAASNGFSQIDHIVVPDSQLFFAADFCRPGPDLVLIGQDGRLLGYFATENHATLTAPIDAICRHRLSTSWPDRQAHTRRRN
jgi:hypothetical protein